MYLEYIDTRSNKFWESYQKGNEVVTRWGSRTTNPPFREPKIFSSSEAARTEHAQKVKEKFRKGYEPATRPSDAPDIPLPGFNAPVTEQSSLDPNPEPEPEPTPQEYYVAWKTSSQNPITEKHIQSAWRITVIVLKDAGDLFKDVRVKAVKGSQGPFIHFIEQGKTICSFGFMPNSFYKALTKREQQIFEAEESMGRDGWLSNFGIGTGVMYTEKKLVDFPVKLFLSVLQVEANLTVNCTEKCPYTQTGFNLPPGMENLNFDWWQHWQTIKPYVSTHWLIDGEIKLRFSVPSINPELLQTDQADDAKAELCVFDW